MKLQVKCTKLKLLHSTNLVILDLHFLSDYLLENYPEGSLHAVFLLDHSITQLICRNSWGHHHDPLKVDKTSKAIKSYWSVDIKKFSYMGDDDVGEITLMRYREDVGYLSIYEKKWTGYNKLRGEFNHYVDEFGNLTENEENSFHMGLAWDDKDEHDLKPYKFDFIPLDAGDFFENYYDDYTEWPSSH